MRNVCNCCKKGKPCIRTRVYQGECIGSTEVYLCNKCYKNTLQIESENYKNTNLFFNYILY